MSDALVIGGVRVPVRVDNAAEEIETIGSLSKSASGRLRGDVSPVRRVWSFSTPELPLNDSARIEAAMQETAEVSCSGALLGGQKTCIVRITGFSHSRGPQSGLRRAIHFQLIEVQ